MLKLIISIALFAAAIVLTVVSVARKSIGGRIHATAAGAAMCLIAAIGLHVRSGAIMSAASCAAQER